MLTEWWTLQLFKDFKYIIKYIITFETYSIPKLLKYKEQSKVIFTIKQNKHSLLKLFYMLMDYIHSKHI